MEIMNASSALALFETTKEQRAIFARNVINEVREGNVDVLKIHMQIKSTEHLLDTLKDTPEYKALLLESAEKHGKKFETYNAEFQVKESGTKWDYSKCEDSKLAELREQIESLTKQLKEREKLLQTIPETGLADPDTGNMIYRAAKSSTTIVQCTLK